MKSNKVFTIAEAGVNYNGSIIENFSHISTAAVVNGGVNVKEGVFFGSNAVSKEYITIVKDTFIKARSIIK